MAVKNSLSTLLEQLVVLNNNSLETFEKVNNAITSNEESVQITLTDPKDSTSTKTYQLPSFGYLKNAIQRLENSIATITNVNEGSGSTIRLSDGTYRKIITAKVPSEAPSITKSNNVTTFNFKSNWFFENMLNPLLYVNYDLTDQVSIDTERVIIQRYILDCDNATKETFFDTTFKNNPNIDYKDFLYKLIQNKIAYVLDEEVKDLPPRNKRFTGLFSVERIQQNNGNREYILNTLNYTDENTGFENTRILNVGDCVEVNTQPVHTRYEITNVDTARNAIQLRLVEGYKAIKVGVDQLKFSASKDNSVHAEISVGFNERCVVFIKPIDPDSNIPAANWSPGIGFYTNALTYRNPQGELQTLQQFYQKNVIDIGQMLLSYNDDYYPSIREGLIPNTPILHQEDFRVVQINKQITDTNNENTIKELVKQKKELEGELTQLSTSIQNLRTKIQTTRYTTIADKETDKNELTNLINEQSTKSSEYSNVVTEIQTRADSIGTRTPKYRIRGFWQIPDARVSESSGAQEIIKFKIRYRYLSADGAANSTDEYTITNDNSTSKAAFSNWNLIESSLRPRVLSKDGVWVWEDVDTSNFDDINMNQLDIAITKGEQVEIQVKSVSEAGYPSNPLESDWSESVILSFPEELQTDGINGIIEQNKQDSAKNALRQELVSMGVKSHVNSSFTTNDTYFAHDANSIASGFLSPEQTPIDLFSKLTELQNKIEQLQEIIDLEQGEIKVTLIDENNDITYLNEGDTTYINACYYKDEVNKLNSDQQKGAIITKVFNVNISNTAQTQLQLISRLNGSRTSMVPNTITDFTDWVDAINKGKDGMNSYLEYENILSNSSTSSDYYNTMGRYDLVPINLTNSNKIDLQISSYNMYQSAQCRGQFIYSRFRNIGDTYDLYANSSNTINNEEVGMYSTTAQFTDSEYIYTNENSHSTGFNSITNKESVNWNNDENDVIGSAIVPKTWNVGASNSNGKFSLSLSLNFNTTDNDDDIKDKIATATKIINPSTINKRISALKSNTVNNNIVQPKIQAAYGFGGFDIVNNGTDENTKNSLIRYYPTHLIGFEEKARYYNGPATCNSFLFMSPSSHEDIQVDGDSIKSKRYVKFGAENSINVPIIYQTRMEDYEGNKLGDASLTETSNTVKNTVYANIIGLDIWVDRTYPLQYDIVVYSKYSSDNSTVTKKSSDSLLLTKALNDVTTSANKMLQTATATASANSKTLQNSVIKKTNFTKKQILKK